MISKAVIPAGGFGTRFLPATKVQPKEMLPIVDIPTIQLVVEEVVNAGIPDILMVTGRGKHAIENHFDRTFELEAGLAAQGKIAQLKLVRELGRMAHIHFIRQQELNGLADAIRYARHHVGKDPFIALLGDTICDCNVPCARQLIDVYSRFQSGILAVEEVPREQVDRYGIVAAEEMEPGVYRVQDIVEKPDPADAPSCLAVAGRYAFTPDIFQAIDRISPDCNGELQITDAIRLLNREQPFYAFRFAGRRYGIGDRMDYLRAIVELALKREDVGPDFREFLMKILVPEQNENGQEK